MANADTPFGLKPIRHLKGGPWNGLAMKCYIPADDSTRAFFIGDAVDLAGSADGDGSCPTVSVVTVGASYPIFGVIVAFEPDPADLTLTYRKDDTARYCYVCCDPDVIYEIQASSTAVLGASNVGNTACLIGTHSGDTNTGYSGIELDSGSVGPGVLATYPLVILGAVPRSDNDISAVNAKWQVLIGLHRLRPNYDTHATAYSWGTRGV